MTKDRNDRPREPRLSKFHGRGKPAPLDAERMPKLSLHFTGPRTFEASGEFPPVEDSGTTDQLVRMFGVAIRVQRMPIYEARSLEEDEELTGSSTTEAPSIASRKRARALKQRPKPAA